MPCIRQFQPPERKIRFWYNNQSLKQKSHATQSRSEPKGEQT